MPNNAISRARLRALIAVFTVAVPWSASAQNQETLLSKLPAQTQEEIASFRAFCKESLPERSYHADQGLDEIKLDGARAIVVDYGSVACGAAGGAGAAIADATLRFTR
jgi:hypothetical protein